MSYEIDFIGVNEPGKDADAIAFRWQNKSGKYSIGIYDGGYKTYGEELGKILDNYYFGSGEGEFIDFVVCSHPDQDHIEGLKFILENYSVGCMYVNIPWLYVDELFELLKDGRITKESLEQRLKEEYKPLNELVEIAMQKRVCIKPAFQGDCILNDLFILSPSKDFYLQLLAESRKTPNTIVENVDIKEANIFGRARKFLYSLVENWNKESLRDGESTSAENEMSVVLLAGLGVDCLFTGDVGVRGLTESLHYLRMHKYNPINNIKFYQIPHHGGRHNIGPSILNCLVGSIVKENQVTNKVAFISAAKGSDHPYKMVVNGFIRRGVKVFSTNGKSLWHHNGTPQRSRYSDAVNLGFTERVEEWN